jgi:hypothetical protein
MHMLELQTCGFEGRTPDGESIYCNLPRGHGGVHAVRTYELRREPDGPPTTVYATVVTWADGQVSRPVQR